MLDALCRMAMLPSNWLYFNMRWHSIFASYDTSKNGPVSQAGRREWRNVILASHLFCFCFFWGGIVL